MVPRGPLFRSSATPSIFCCLSKLVSRPFSLTGCFALTLYVSLLFIFFLFYPLHRNFPDDLEREETLFMEETQQVIEERLWRPSLSRGFRPCTKPTSRYEGPKYWNRYLTVRSNGGLNQMRAGVIHVPKSDSRLSNNDLPIDIQRLRCRAFYYALRFSPPIEQLGKKLVGRLKSHGRYISLHLRYEKDMLSFTGCTYGLSDEEAEELKIMRENTNHWKTKKINATEQRIGGYCPLTPKEMGIFLKALGHPPSTWIYIAAGEIYGGDAHLSELRSYFPNLVFKETVATSEELEPFAKHASQTAALDYIISVESDVFVPSYSGNMARALEGHRRFLGHRKTFSPDRKGLVEVFDKMERGKLKEGQKLSSRITEMHKFRQGAPRKRLGALPGVKGRGRFRTEESFYENPFPECICSSRNLTN
ncbi:uncharacterized protein At1g04910 isoform X2 [Amborella trichopoda]|uniref:uncharacterized protein At1g04910 isoform X2 n=1 Tax=Amborella trichopoda TaxID=13333 RepID=UPI0009BD27AA|nr:uncharacterized protein At1g04910 isoform X2 [Amborella trichopoda]|eukprot:XP_020531753.1 uncharacterized protein At1g04910 isoform X2 [Amborella trichopoda]